LFGGGVNFFRQQRALCHVKNISLLRGNLSPLTPRFNAEELAEVKKKNHLNGFSAGARFKPR
jgi:hypothetical protein